MSVSRIGSSSRVTLATKREVLPSLTQARRINTACTPRQIISSRRSEIASIRPTINNTSIGNRSISSLFKTATQTSDDVVIVGGGVVGLALACSLASDPAFRSAKGSITLVEASPLDKLRSWSKTKQFEGQINDWENRAIYLTEENRDWLADLGVEEFLLSNRVGPVHSMHVTDGLTGAALDFDVSNPHDSQLGTMVEISNLQQAMLSRIEELKSKYDISIRVLDGTKVEIIEAMQPDQIATPSSYTDAWPLVHLSGDHKPIKARLLVGADGNNSPVRKYAGIKAQGWPYGRMGVVATVKTAQNLALPSISERVAHQRFLPTGTIAWLPLSNDSASIVWTLPPDVAKALTGLQKQFESEANNEVSPLAHLITAAFRLPWDSLSPILTRIASNASLEIQDHSWIVPAIQEQLMTSALEHGSNQDVPVPAASILKGSVAGFPLKLSHAEAYLGSSLRQTSIAEAGAGALLPSTFLQKAIEGVSSVASGLSGAQTTAEPGISSIARGRTVLVGDAAHTIHPLAGQGLNLGLADARALGETLLEATAQGGDLGSHTSLQSYPRQRYIANQVMLSAVDHLHWLFVTPSPPGNPTNSIMGDLISRATIWGRSTGFEVLNELDIVKKAIIGAAGSKRSSQGSNKPRTNLDQSA
ncbi:ubiquinone biosynthesis hydrox [Meira miltonrushii]|uniref:Ubiquinone biosynthesis hydrox n=1 Tax=Meira miltonrushii TaxID=1280837 RepID=A0A316VIP6_9BASI|nr:ubiquinone biosynthesis hydrox [Meira miltonrushii]PWN36928.1 ubiquinone biosynthesis hydrox [Meira miltonrushii]